MTIAGISSSFPINPLGPAMMADGIEKVAALGNGIVGNISETFRQMPDHLAKIGLSYTTLGAAFYTMRLPFYYIEYFVHRAKEDGPAGIIGSILNFFSDVCSAFQWFGNLKIIDLGKIAAAIGRVPVIGFLAKLSLGLISGVLFGVGNFFFAIDAVIKLAKGNLSRSEEIAAWMDLASSVLQVAFMILTLVGCTIVPLLITVVVAAGVFTTFGFCFHYIPMLMKSTKNETRQSLST